jgi:hypothetical protein
MAGQVRHLLAQVELGVEQARLAWFDIGALLLEARRSCASNEAFGRWFARQDFADDIGPHNRAALIKLAMNRRRAQLILGSVDSDRVSPRYMLAQIEGVIAATGGDPLAEWRDEPAETSASCLPSQDADVPLEEPDVAGIPAPAPGIAQAADSECTTSRAVSNPPRLRRTWLAGVHPDDEAMLRQHYTVAQTRSVIGNIAKKPAGRKVLTRIAALVRAGDIPTPSDVHVVEPSARLVVPELRGGPLAMSYDLTKESGLDRLLADLPDIRAFAIPAQPAAGVDRSDRGGAALRAARRQRDQAPMIEAAQRRVVAEVEGANAQINPQGHPPITIAGVQMWPDGHLAQRHRLTHEKARMCYRLWWEFDSLLRHTIGLDDRAHKWQVMSRLLDHLDGDRDVGAIGYFFHRAGLAMKANPDAYNDHSEGLHLLGDRVG